VPPLDTVVSLLTPPEETTSRPPLWIVVLEATPLPPLSATYWMPPF
jgi:hypothetical protein